MRERSRAVAEQQAHVCRARLASRQHDARSRVRVQIGDGLQERVLHGHLRAEFEVPEPVAGHHENPAVEARYDEVRVTVARVEPDRRPVMSPANRFLTETPPREFRTDIEATIGIGEQHADAIRPSNREVIPLIGVEPTDDQRVEARVTAERNDLLDAEQVPARRPRRVRSLGHNSRPEHRGDTADHERKASHDGGVFERAIP